MVTARLNGDNTLWFRPRPEETRQDVTRMPNNTATKRAQLRQQPHKQPNAYHIPA